MIAQRLQARIARTVVLLLSASLIQIGISAPQASAAAPVEPTISSISSGATSLTVNMVTTGIDASSWRYKVTRRVVSGCANPGGDGVVLTTGSLSSTISITGLTSGCIYSIGVAGFNGVIGDYAESEKLVGGFTNGLNAYYKNEAGSSATMTRSPFTTGTCGTGSVSAINIDYVLTGPLGCNVDGFTTYYLGYVKAPITGVVNFKSRSDDGFYLSIQGQSIISDSGDHPASVSGSFDASGSISMVANEIYRIEAWHHENGSGAAAFLDWEYSGQNQINIPSSSFATDPSVFFGTCPLGSASRCAAGSAVEIKQSTGTNMDGMYWIVVNGTPTLTYCIMNSAMSGGGWMLAMKGKKAGSTFSFDSSYWTNSTQLNDSFPERWKSGDSQRDIDAKYGVFSYNKGNQIMALFPEQTGYAGGAIAAGTTGNTSLAYGFSWIETTTAMRPWTSYNAASVNGNPAGWGGTSWNIAMTGGPTATPTCVNTATTLSNLFNTASRCAFRQVQYTYNASESPYSAIGQNLFYAQNQIRFFGINYGSSSTSNRDRARFGFGWNENNPGDEGSSDGTSGIGIDRQGYSSITTGSINQCCDQTAQNLGQTGISGVSVSSQNIPFEMYLRNSTTASITGSNLRISFKRSSSLTSGNGYTATGTNGTNTFRLSPLREGFYINPTTGAITVSEAIAVGTYTTNVTVTDTDGVSGNKSVTIQVIADSSETDTALNFTGSSSLSTSASVLLNGSQTWEAWVKPTSGCADSTQKTVFGSSSFVVLCISGYWYTGFRESGGGWTTVQSSQRIVYDSWTHISVVRSGTTVSFYINNARTRVYSGNAWADTFNVATIYGTAANFYLAGYGAAQYFAGAIDEFKVWSEARTLTQITDGMYAAPNLGSSNLVGYWDLNDGSGTAAISRSQQSDSTYNFSPTSGQWVTVSTTTTSGPYTVVSFPRTPISSTPGWRVPDSVTAVSVLLVGGGGGGGGSFTDIVSSPAGAGGGGGVYFAAAVPMIPNSRIPITVGVGGAGGIPTNVRADTRGYQGASSSFETLIAGGGGGGGYYDASNQVGLAGTAGGGGGGANYSWTANTSGAAGAGSSTTVNGKTFAASNSAGAGANFNNGTNPGYSGGGAGGAAAYNVRGAGITSSITGTPVSYGTGGGALNVTGWSFSAQSATGNGGDGIYNESTGGAQGGNGLIVIRYITALKPSFTKPTNTTINLGMVESFTTNALVDSATTGLTRTFRWESTTAGSGGTYSAIKSGTGFANASFSWTPSDTRTTGSNYLYRVVVTDSDADGLFIVDTSTAVFAVINGTLSLISKTTLTKTVNISKIETFTVLNGTPTYRYTLSPDGPNFWLDTSTVGLPRIQFSDTATVGTYYETFTVTDSISASISVPLTIVISPPPSFSAGTSLVDSGTVLYLDAGNSASYPRTGNSWSDISGRGLRGDLVANLGSKIGSSSLNTCNAPAFTTELNGAFTFSSTVKNCLYTANVGTLQSYTVETWFRRAGPQTAYSTLFATPYSASGKQINIALLWINSTDLIAGLYNGSTWTWSAQVTIADYAWTYAAVTFSGSALTLYVNNVASTPTTGISITWDSAKLDAGLVFGRKWDGDTEWFNGAISTVRLFNRVLSSTELTQNYNATKNRFTETLNPKGIKARYGLRINETYTVTGGSESLTVTFAANAITGITWDTSTARSLKIQVAESLTVGAYWDTITVTDIYGSSSNFPIRVEVGKAPSIVISMNTATATTYNGSPIATYPKPVITGLQNSDTGTVTTKFSSILYSLSAVPPTNADTYTVTGADFTFTTGALSNYISVVYETSTAVINRARQTPLNVSMYGAVVGSPFTITLLGGSGDGAVVETLTGVSTAPNCAVSNRILTSSATSTSYCQITVTKAQSQNYLAESSTVQIYFMVYIISQPSSSSSSGAGIGLTGATAIVRDPNQAPTITLVQLQTICNVMGCSSSIQIAGAGFGSAYNIDTIVKFWRNKFVTLGGPGSSNYVVNDSSIMINELPAGITTGKITVTTANGIAVSPDNWIVP